MIDIITLFSGRWNTWEPYWEGIKKLDWDRDRLRLVWYTNAKRNFVEFLQFQARKAPFEIRIFHDESLRPSDNAFVERGKRPVEHAFTIASLYNAATNTIKNKKRVFFIEDDVYAPSCSLKFLMRDLDLNKKACYAAGVVFDRHAPRIFGWDFELMPKGWEGNSYAKYQSFPPRVTWGVQRIGMAHLGLTLIDFKRIPTKFKFPIFRPQVKIKGAEQFIGCDVVFCFYAWKYGSECLQDYGVRGLHYDSRSNPH